MVYVAKNTDNSISVTVQDGVVNTTYSVGLVGIGYTNYAQTFAENALKQMENFASNTPPPRPIPGQLWYNKATKTLNYFDGKIFNPLTTGVPATSGPSTADVSVTNLAADNIVANTLAVTDARLDHIVGLTLDYQDAVIGNLTVTGNFNWSGLKLLNSSLSGDFNGRIGTITPNVGFFTNVSAKTVTANSFVGGTYSGFIGNLFPSAARFTNVTAKTLVADSFTGSFTGAIGQSGMTFPGSFTDLSADNLKIKNTFSAATISATNGFVGTILTNYQPYITSLGSLTNLKVDGDSVLSNLSVNNLTVSGNVNFPPGTNFAFDNLTVKNLGTFGNVATKNVVADTLKGLLLTNVQPYITKVGTLTELKVTTPIQADITGNASFATDSLTSREALRVTDPVQPFITTLSNLTNVVVNGSTDLGAPGTIKISGGGPGNVLGKNSNDELDWLNLGSITGKSSGMYYNVKDFGAMGDNNTDDTANIRKAITAAGNNGGGVVYFPAGKYIISDALVINVPNIKIMGDGMDISTIISTNDGHAILQFGSKSDATSNAGSSSAQDISLQFGKIISTSSTNTGTVYSIDTPAAGSVGIYLSGNNGYFRNIWIRNTYIGIECDGLGGGVYGEDFCNTNDFSKFQIYNSVYAGIYIHNHAANITCKDLLFIIDAPWRSAKFNNWASGGQLRLENHCQGHQFHNCNTYGGKLALYAKGDSDTDGVRVAACRFLQCYFDSTYDGCFLQYVADIEFLSCWWSDRPNNGLNLYNGHSVRFIGGGAWGGENHGIVINNSDNVSFNGFSAGSNSQVTSQVGFGIVIASGTTDVSITGCTFGAKNILFGEPSLQGGGIRLDQGIDRIIITNCLVTNKGGQIVDNSGNIQKWIMNNTDGTSTSSSINTTSTSGTAASYTPGDGITFTGTKIGFSGTYTGDLFVQKTVAAGDRDNYLKYVNAPGQQNSIWQVSSNSSIYYNRVESKFYFNPMGLNGLVIIAPSKVEITKNADLYVSGDVYSRGVKLTAGSGTTTSTTSAVTQFNAVGSYTMGYTTRVYPVGTDIPGTAITCASPGLSDDSGIQDFGVLRQNTERPTLTGTWRVMSPCGYFPYTVGASSGNAYLWSLFQKVQ